MSIGLFVLSAATISIHSIAPPLNPDEMLLPAASIGPSLHKEPPFYHFKRCITMVFYLNVQTGGWAGVKS